MVVNDIYYVKAIRVFVVTSRCIKTYACIINTTGKEKDSVLWPCSAPVSSEHSALRTSCLIDDLLSLDTYLMPVWLEAGRGHGFSRCLCKPYEHRVQRGEEKWVNCVRRRREFFFFPQALFVFYAHCFLLWTRAVSSYLSNWQHERKSSVFSVAARVWMSRLVHWPIDCPDRKLKKQTEIVPQAKDLMHLGNLFTRDRKIEGYGYIFPFPYLPTQREDRDTLLSLLPPLPCPG